MIKGIERAIPMLTFDYGRRGQAPRRPRTTRRRWFRSITNLSSIVMKTTTDFELLHTNVRKYGTISNTVAEAAKLRASSGEKRDRPHLSGKSSHHLPAPPANVAGQEMFCSQRAFMEEVNMTLREVVLCAPVRTAIGTYNGSLKATPATVFDETVNRELLRRAELDPAKLRAVVMGNVIQAGNKMNPARQAAIYGSVPVDVP